MMDIKGGDDADINTGVCDVRLSFHLMNDDNYDDRRHKNKSNTIITIQPYLGGYLNPGPPPFQSTWANPIKIFTPQDKFTSVS